MKASIGISILAHLGLATLALAWVSAPTVKVPRARYISHVTLDAPSPVAVPQPPPPPVRVARIAMPVQGTPARALMGVPVPSRISLPVTAAQPAFGELPVQGQVELPEARKAVVKAAPQVKLADFGIQHSGAFKVGGDVALQLNVLPVVEPTITFMEHPEYTAEALHARVEGTVTMMVTFKSDGTILVIGTIKRLGHGLDESAVRTVETVKFHPATYDGAPVDYTTKVRITYQLD